MSKIKLLFLLFLIIVFLVGLYVTMFYGKPVKVDAIKRKDLKITHKITKMLANALTY